MLDQEFVPNTPGAVLDSAGMLNILQGTLGSGTRVKLTGITGDSTEAEITDAVFPVITTDGKRYLIRIQGQNIIARKAKKLHHVPGSAHESGVRRQIPSWHGQECQGRRYLAHTGWEANRPNI
jgi:hypothetical protein